MDVTRLIGALRAGDGRAPTAREGGPGFESFLPADDGPARRATERPDAPARRPERAERSEHRADQRRAEQHRADERRIEERRAQRRSEERRAEQRRAEQRRAEERRAEERRAESERAERRADARTDARRAEEQRQAERAAARAEARAERDPPDAAAAQTPTRRDDAPDAARRARPAAERPDDAGLPRPPGESGELSGALGMVGLVEWLQGRVAADAPPIRDAAPLDPPPAPDADIDDEAIDLDDLHLDLELEADAEGGPEAEFTRLLEARSLSDALSRGPARTQPDSVQIGPQRSGDGGAPIGPAPLPAAARIGDAGLAARAGATPTALPQGVDESSIMRQISDALRLREGRGEGTRTAEIQLHPAELGRVRVRIQMEAGAARVFVAAEHAAVGDLLGAGLDQLRRDLLAQGVQIAHLEVRSGLAEDGGGRRDAPEHEEAEEREAPAEAPRPTARRPRGRIDLEA